MRIKPYSSKPKIKFFGPGPWWIGMELEVEAAILEWRKAVGLPVEDA